LESNIVDYEEEFYICPECDGRGYIDKKGKCPLCKGKGAIDSKISSQKDSDDPQISD
jgi:DnaJ-class molecular chaperone